MKSVPRPGVVTIIVHEGTAEFVVARPENLYEKPLTEWPAQCYAIVVGQTLIPSATRAGKYGAEREVRQIRLELTLPVFAHEGEIPGLSISLTGY